MSDTENTGSVELFRYETASLRTVVIDGEPWFVATDVARILEYSATSAMTRRLDDEDKGVRDLHTPGGAQKLIVISEAGFYAAILGSQSIKARVIKRWLTHEVLPTIRKTGTYSTVPTLTGPELMATALLEAAATLKAKDQQIAELEAPARAWNNLADAKGNYSVAEAAKILSQDPNIRIGRDRLFDFMHSKRWIFRSRNPRGGWEARQEQVDTGRLYERPARPFLNAKSGEYELPAPTLRVTVKGIARLHDLLGGSGQLTLSDAA
ncbi:phage antirepressor [Rhodococcus sp. MSC1_016]|jgi:anti-repressor protein|uniref:phage antirepressor n=1 Tax=Rhodococcus sp. MSC1_016 TaxID=2909266 RepID=UPI00202E0416|nr:BRO family protein [Rhodococcus sp. MSC1_016]